MTITRIQDFLTRRAATSPTATAIVSGSEIWTYGKLDSISNQIANALLGQGVRPGDRIALFLPKTPWTIAAMHGVLKAGCIYVPIDLSSPPDRTSRIVENCAPHSVLVCAQSLKLFDACSKKTSHQASVAWIDAKHLPQTPVSWSSHDLDLWPSAAPTAADRSDENAHILFTSGSTGMPKGVPIRHSSVISFVNWAVDHFKIAEQDRNSSHPPLHFDLSTFDIYATLAAGAELHLVPTELNLLPARMSDFIRQSRLTQWFSVPSLLNHMAVNEAFGDRDFPDLRRVLWCGEVFPTSGLIHWMRKLPHVRFTNLYGPTEATIASSYYDVQDCPADATQPIPIGSPCDGEELLVLDDEMRPSEPGVIGNLYIAGVGLSQGYWRDAEKTARVFIADPRPGMSDSKIYRTGDLARRGQDGLIYYVGRSDTQIKSRGHRIELGEIETALSSLPAVKECAVVALKSPSLEGYSICCAYIPRDQGDIGQNQLRKQAAELLPPYMIPHRWMVLQNFEKNANGKIDRLSLQEMFERSGSD